LASSAGPVLNRPRSILPRFTDFLTAERQRTKELNLAKEDSIEVLGKVVEKFKAGMFSIELDAGKTVLATMAGRLRRNRIKIMNGDRVTLELSPYDLTKGRITYRHK
jgi:translation initiation factor IF-1